MIYGNKNLNTTWVKFVIREIKNLKWFKKKMKEDILKNYSMDEVARLIYNEFVKDNNLTEKNVREKFENFEKFFWLKYYTQEELSEPLIEDKRTNIFFTVWMKISELERELRLKNNEFLNTMSNDEIVDLIFDQVKKQDDLSSLNLNIYWKQLGIETTEFPRFVNNRLDQIDNGVWQKVKALKKQRKLEETERERNQAFKFIPKIIEWVKEKGFKKLSKINLQLFLSEQKMNISPVNRQALYLEVNKQLSKL